MISGLLETWIRPHKLSGDFKTSLQLLIGIIDFSSAVHFLTVARSLVQRRGSAQFGVKVVVNAEVAVVICRHVLAAVLVVVSSCYITDY